MKGRILVVEDSATQAEALRALLLDAGHQVAVARSGEAALEALGSDPFDLVLSDVMMPGMSGYDLCRRLKDHEVLRATPLVLLTSLADPMDIVRGLEAGADNYITKPFDPEHLLARVNHVLGNRRLRRDYKTSMGVTVNFLGSDLTITSDREQILDLLLSSVEDVIRTNRALEESRRELERAHAELESYALERAREAQSSTERYRTLMRHAADAIFVVRADGVVLEANEQAGRLLGVPEEELVGRPVLGLVHPSERDEFRARFARLREAGGQLALERAMLHADGHTVYCEGSATRIALGDEQIVLTILRDVTERHLAEERLRRSERSLAEAQKIARLGSWEWEVGTDRLEWSEEVYRICGLAPEEFDLSLAAAMPLLVPEDAQRLRAAMEAAGGGGPPVDEEVRLLQPGGPPVILVIRGERVAASGDAPLRVVGTAQDITTSREAARRLEESEERYRSLFQYNPDAVYSLDPQGRFTSANPACERLTRRPAAQLLGELFDPLLVEEDRERVRVHFADALRGEPQAYQTAARTEDGRRVELSVTNTPIVVGGQITGVFGIAEDVTEHKRAQEALRESEETFRTLVEASPVAIVLMASDGRTRLWNRAAEQTFGWAAAEVVGRPPPFVETDAADFRHNFQRLMLGETLQGLEVRRHRKDESTVDLVLSASPLRRPSGEIVGVVAVMSDVTKRKRAEEALRRSEEQLRQSQKMDAVGQLAGGIAHDFNNLLTVIKGNTQLVLSDVAADDPLRADLEEIDQSVDRAANLTRQLLTFSRKQLIEPRVLSLNEVVSHTDRLLRRVLGEHITLESTLDPGAGCVQADHGQLEQVLLNLAVNARDAMPDGGHLSIRTGRVRVAERVPDGDLVPPGEYVVLTVADTGQGMSGEVQARAFEPFFTTKPQGRGTGLGLSTVYGIVQQSAGHIRLDSAPGRGTRFDLYFPRVEEDQCAEPASQEAVAAAPASGTVLLVEDEPGVRSVTRRILERAGYRVHVAESGEAALNLLEAQEGTLDLLVTDVVMPGLSGRELAARALARFPGLRVLFMSGYDEAVAEPADAELIQKPFTPQEMAARVAELLRPAG